MSTTANFNAEEFVNNLIKNGSNTPCDNTNDKYNEYQLPPNFDETKFKRGQRFYHDNIFSLFIGKLAGLVAILAVPTILKILIFTNMSSTPYTAYKRYMSTIFHMNIWYTDDFKPGSKTWKSMEDVRRKHNNASRRSSCIGASRITQLDMALTQFGFIGFVLAKPEQVGLFQSHLDTVGLEGWVYLWRIIGDLMGIEDRFNICRSTVEETREICRLLIERQFKTYVEQGDANFKQMATTLIDGMTVMQPFLCPDLAYVKILRLVAPDGNIFKEELAKLTPDQLWYYNFEQGAINSCKNSFFRWYHNMSIHVSLWLMKYFPFLAIWKYGRQKAYVHILEQPVNATNQRMFQSG